MNKADLYDAVRRNKKFDNAQFLIIPLIEKTLKNDSGHWLLFVVDLVKDKIYLLDPCNEFEGSYGACKILKKVFLYPYLSYKAENRGPIDKPTNKKINVTDETL